MNKILVLNNYPLDEVWDEVRRKEKPDHHIFGINYFHLRGYEVKIVPFSNYNFFQGLNYALRKMRSLIPPGNLAQQICALRFIDNSDLIYVPCQDHVNLLNYMRALRLIKIPIVCLAHHPLNPGRFHWVRRPFIRLIARGTDTFPALSSKIADEIKTVYNGRSCLLQLGPDASYYPQDTQSGEGVIAAGRTGRDFITFGMAASQTGVNARIICLRSSASPAFKSFNSNIQITVYPDEDYMKYPQLLRLYAKSRVLAIPLLPQENLCGLTSLMDALGMGKPVIMTRNRFIDIDIEKEGIGKWVEPFDIEGWKRAICWFEDNRDKAISMGRRARELVDKGLNSAAFANRIMDMFDTLLKRKI